MDDCAENFLREPRGKGRKNQPEVFKEKGKNGVTNRWGRVEESSLLMKWEYVHCFSFWDCYGRLIVCPCRI